MFKDHAEWPFPFELDEVIAAAENMRDAMNAQAEIALAGAPTDAWQFKELEYRYLLVGLRRLRAQRGNVPMQLTLKDIAYLQITT